MKHTSRIFLILSLCFIRLYSHAAIADTIAIPSKAMGVTYKAIVVKPDTYKSNQVSYPVLYLLHGGSGHYSDWITNTPNPNLVKNLADQYNMIFVLPEGEEFGWYLDSPFDKKNQFETYITKEVIPSIDKNYRTISNKNGRVITGLSMGGHGAMYLANRNPDLFAAAGTMSGAMDMDYTKYDVNADFKKALKEGFEKLLGTQDLANDLFVKNSIINMVENIKKNNMPIIIDCGVDDFLIEVNRELHQRLLYRKIPHDYTERPGGHSWEYWENSLPYHVLFFSKALKNGSSAIK
jgi:putative tributyrin esterase